MVRVVLLLVMGVVHAATTFNLDKKKVIETHLSNRDFNRITIEKDRITQMVFNRDEFLVVIDEVNGQIFIRPTKLTSKYPLGFTLTTEKNKTQDWLFTFKNVKARTLILQDDQSKTVKSINCQEQAIKLLNKLINGEKVNGLINQNKLIPVEEPWKLKRIKYVVDGDVVGHVLELQNTSKKAKEIQVAELWMESMLAINVDQTIVEPGEFVRVVMVTDDRGLLTNVDEMKKGSSSAKEAFSWYTNRGVS